MLPVSDTYSMVNIPSVSELFLQTLPIVRAIKPEQLFVLEFSKDGLGDLGDEFEDSGAANQQMVMQGGVGLSSGQVSQGYGQFEYKCLCLNIYKRL